MSEAHSETIARQRQRILKVAIELIDSDGVEAVSARKIASILSCAVGSLYRSFDNLNAILLAVNLETLKALEADVRASIQHEEDAKQTIRDMGMAYIHYVMRHPHRWQLVMQDIAVNKVANRRDMDAYQAQQQRMFQMIEAAFLDVKPLPSKQVAYLEARTLWASLDGLCNLACRGKIDSEGDEGVHVFAEILLEHFLGVQS